MSDGMSATVLGLGKDAQVLHTGLLLSHLQELEKAVAVIKCSLGLCYCSRTHITQRNQWEAGNILSHETCWKITPFHTRTKLMAEGPYLKSKGRPGKSMIFHLLTEHSSGIRQQESLFVDN